MSWDLVEASHRIVCKPWVSSKRQNPPTDYGGRFAVVPNVGELAPGLNILFFAQSLKTNTFFPLSLQIP